MSGHVENFNTGIFSDTVKLINVKLCMTVLHIGLYLFITLSYQVLVTLTFFKVTGMSDS